MEHHLEGLLMNSSAARKGLRAATTTSGLFGTIVFAVSVSGGTSTDTHIRINERYE